MSLRGYFHPEPLGRADFPSVLEFIHFIESCQLLLLTLGIFYYIDRVIEVRMSKSSRLTEQINEFLMYEMASLSPKVTGVPLAIFVSPRMGQHGPRIKVGLKPSDFKSGNTLSLTISDNPEVVAGTVKLDKHSLEIARQWIILNKDILLRFWNDDTMYMDDLYDNLQKING